MYSASLLNKYIEQGKSPNSVHVPLQQIEWF